MDAALSGKRAFLVVWIGQVVSLFGSALTTFALSIWAWDLTGEATALALVAFFGTGPTVILSPVAGALVDRWNRKLVMMLSDLATGLSTVAMFLLLTAGALEIWHVYVASAFAGAFQAFQWPAYSASVTLMLPKEHYARASAMLSMARSGATVFAPIMAAFLITIIDVGGVMLIDIVTFVVAVSALLIVHIPQPEASAEGDEGRGKLWQESIYGFRYIWRRPSLLGLQIMFFLANLFATVMITLLSPLVLARTGGDQVLLGYVQSAAGIGGIAGGILVSVWGGPKRRVHGVLLGMVGLSLFGQVVVGLGQTVIVWMAGGFVAFVFITILDSSNQSIWQSKVAPDVQGRVFAVRRLIAQISAPLAMLAAGPLADLIFEPAMMPGGALAESFGPLVGTGPGAGMGLMLVITGVMGALAALSGYLFRAIRDAEAIIPDHMPAAAD